MQAAMQHAIIIMQHGARKAGHVRMRPGEAAGHVCGAARGPQRAREGGHLLAHAHLEQEGTLAVLHGGLALLLRRHVGRSKGDVVHRVQVFGQCW